MDARTGPVHVDQVIGTLADRQHGVVARWQLQERAIGRSAIEVRLRSDRLRRLHAGVYAVGHRAIGPRGHVMAAVLAGGPGAVASHRSAADLWRVRPHNGTSHDVSVRTRSGRRPKGITVHRPRTLLAHEITEIDGIPVTTLARTLLDLADVVDDKGLRRAVARAEVERAFDLRAVQRAIDDHPHRQGKRLAAAARTADLTPVDSDLERDFLDLVAELDVPKPEAGALVGSHRVDFFWPEEGVAVEVDSFRYHGTRTAYEADKRRDTQLALHGVTPYTVTDRRLRHEREAVKSELRALLLSRPSAAAPDAAGSGRRP